MPRYCDTPDNSDILKKHKPKQAAKFPMVL